MHVAVEAVGFFLCKGCFLRFLKPFQWLAQHDAQLVCKGIQQLLCQEPLVRSCLLPMHAEGEVLAHETPLDTSDASLLQRLAEMGQTLVAIQFCPVSKTSRPCEDTCHWVGRRFLTSLEGAVVSCDGTMGRLSKHGLAVRTHKRRDHEARAAIALRYHVRQHVAVVVLACPHVTTAAFDDLCDHVVNVPVLVPYASPLEGLFIIALIHGFENVNEQAVVVLQRHRFGGQIQRQSLIESMLKATLRKVLDRLSCVVHAHHYSSSGRRLEGVGGDLLLGTAILGLEDDPEGTGTLRGQLRGLVLIPVRMPPNDDGLLPSRNVSRDVRDNNRCMKHRAIQVVADRAIWARPHLLQIELEHPARVRRDSRAFDAHVVPLDGFGSIGRHLIIGFIPVRDAQVVVVDVHVEEREYQFFLDHLPQNASHLVTVQFDNCTVDFDLIKIHLRLDGPRLRALRLIAISGPTAHRPSHQVTKLVDVRPIAAGPLCELPKRHLILLHVKECLVNYSVDLEVCVLQVLKPSVVQHPHSVRQLGSGYQVVTVHIADRKNGLDLILDLTAIAGKQSKSAHLVV
mmetsp:Transcript_55412/g.140131  ORF Transcript_55412/g.140131 Transcript_55412/m.140131 type:complete len:568 (-) Transcript_55412:313-2016(-)